MPRREPDVKRRQLLDAALAEFSLSGLAGTPVDVIARRAGCSPGLIYRYFESKSGLFDAVFEEIARSTVESSPLDTRDLVKYAVRLHDAGEARPDVNRFLAWYELEHVGEGQTPSGPESFFRQKITEISAAQVAGQVRNDVPAVEVAIVIQTLARLWATSAGVVRVVADPAGNAAFRRHVVKAAVSDYLAAGQRSQDQPDEAKSGR